MEFMPAQLDRMALAQLQQFEHELRERTSAEIVVVAYQASADAAQGVHSNGDREQ